MMSCQPLTFWGHFSQNFPNALKLNMFFLKTRVFFLNSPMASVAAHLSQCALKGHRCHWGSSCLMMALRSLQSFLVKMLIFSCIKVKVAQFYLTLCDPMDCSLPGSSVHGNLQAGTLEWLAFPFSRGSSQPRDRTRSPALRADCLPSEPPGKPKNTGVGSLSLLQQTFLTQESNWGLLHCRRILYQLSNQGSKIFMHRYSLFCLTAYTNSLWVPTVYVHLHLTFLDIFLFL